MIDKISLYDCLNARVSQDGLNEYEIQCAAGHILMQNAISGGIKYQRVMRGEPLIIAACQGCSDFIPMGGVVGRHQKGWLRNFKKRVKV